MAEPTQAPKVKSIEFQLRSIDRIMLDAYSKFITLTTQNMGGIANNPTSLPRQIERWTVLSSPFVHKTSRTQFERRTHERLVQCFNLHDELVGRLLWYVRMNAPPDVDISARSFSYLPMEGFFNENQESK